MRKIRVGDIVRFGFGETGAGVVLALREGVLGGTGIKSWKTQGGDWCWSEVVTPRSDEVLIHGLTSEAYGWYNSSDLELVSSLDDDVKE